MPRRMAALPLMVAKPALWAMLLDIAFIRAKTLVLWGMAVP